MGEPSLAGFGGVVFQGEAKAGKSWRRGGAMGASKECLGGHLTLHPLPARIEAVVNLFSLPPDRQSFIITSSQTKRRESSEYNK